MIGRRAFIGGLLATPVVIKAGALMRCAPTEIIRPSPPIVRLGWGLAFASGDTACVAIGDEQRFYSCIRCGFGTEAEFVETPPAPARHLQWRPQPSHTIWKIGRIEFT